MTDEQLIRALRGLDRTVDPEPSFADALFDRLRTEPGRRRSNRTWLSLVAALVALAVVAASLAVGARLLRDGPPAPFQPVQPVNWPLAMGRSGAEVTGITAFDGGFVAVGRELINDSGVGDQGAPMIWVSRDGTAWDAAEIGADMENARDLQTVFTAADGSLVAVGSATGDETPAWRSTDGRTWIPTSLGLSASAPIVVGGPGSYVLIDRPLDPTSNGTFWRSSDGVGWQSVEIPAPRPWLTSAAVGDGRIVVAVCVAPEAEGDWPGDCRAMTTTDGANWQTSAPTAEAVNVARFRGEWLAAVWSSEGGSRLSIQRSDDGLAWQPIAEIRNPPERSRSLVPLRWIVAGDRLILRTGPSYTQTFASNDGRTWHRPTDLAEMLVAGAAARNGTVVLGGVSFGNTALIRRLAP